MSGLIETGRRYVITNPELTGAPLRPAPNRPPAPEHAGLMTKARRLRAELQVWRRAGFPRAPSAVRRARLAACRTCDYYNPRGNLSLGECRAPGCGCTRLKLALATARCPLNPPKWGECSSQPEAAAAPASP
jgi:hypothetical protein